MDVKEISNANYIQLGEIIEKHPTLRTQFVEYMDDNKISGKEFKAILKDYKLLLVGAENENSQMVSSH